MELKMELFFLIKKFNSPKNNWFVLPNFFIFLFELEQPFETQFSRIDLILWSFITEYYDCSEMFSREKCL